MFLMESDAQFYKLCRCRFVNTKRFSVWTLKSCSWHLTNPLKTNLCSSHWYIWRFFLSWKNLYVASKWPRKMPNLVYEVLLICKWTQIVSTPLSHSSWNIPAFFWKWGNWEHIIQKITSICTPDFFWIQLLSQQRYANEVECPNGIGSLSFDEWNPGSLNLFFWAVLRTLHF